MKKKLENFLVFLSLVKMYIYCLFGSMFLVAIIMFFVIAIIESKDRQKIFYLNFSNPSSRIFIMTIFLLFSLIVSIIVYRAFLAGLKKLDKK
jgi:hypothetical protein